MKCVAIALIALVGSGSALRNPRDDDKKTGPMVKVVKMLKDLKAGIQSDEKTEENAYNRFACWCETQTKNKANRITQAEADSRTLSQEILKLKGRVSTLNSEIKEIKGEIADNQESQDKATNLRQKRNAKYQEETEGFKESMAGLEQALKIIGGGQEHGVKDSRDSLALLDSNSAAQAASALKSVLDAIPNDVDVDGDHLSFLSEFVANDGQYAPQSGTIHGILNDMYTTFAKDLQEATHTEAERNHNYESLMANLGAQQDAQNAAKRGKEADKSDAESQLADATQSYDDTQEQMEADIKFFDNAKKSCINKHDLWVTRQKLREQEMDGVQTALDLLSSDDAKMLFKSAIKPGNQGGSASFLQIADDSENVGKKAYDMIKAQATKSKSLRLAMLAVQVRSAKGGHFDEVVKSIDDMIATMEDESQADIDKRNQCKEQYQKIAKTVADLDWKIEKNDAKIEKLQKLMDKREQEKEEAHQQKDETEAYIKKIEKDREEEHEAWQHAKDEDHAALALLSKAKDALTAFYEKQEVDMGPMEFLQVSQEPVFDRGDAAPDAKISGKANRKGENKNIVSLMTMIIEDLEGELKNDAAAERQNQADFMDARAAAKKLVEDLEGKIVNLKNAIENRREEKTEETALKKANNEDRTDELNYQAKIKPDCDWMLENFQMRHEARTAEANGLKSAKEFLLGKTELIQVKHKKASPVANHFLGKH